MGSHMRLVLAQAHVRRPMFDRYLGLEKGKRENEGNCSRPKAGRIPQSDAAICKLGGMKLWNNDLAGVVRGIYQA